MKDAIVVLSTVSSKKEAQKIAKKLIQQRLSACVQILPNLTSTYLWNKKICRDKEFLLIIKSRRSLFSKLAAEIKKNHSYEVPQIIALPIVSGSSSYLQWMKQCLALK